MFDAVADRGRATLRVRLGGHVTVADLDRRAAALACEARLEELQDNGTVVVDASNLTGVDLEAQGVLLFLFQRALRVAGVEIILIAPPSMQEALQHAYARRLLAHPRVRVFFSHEAADVYVLARVAA